MKLLEELSIVNVKSRSHMCQLRNKEWLNKLVSYDWIKKYIEVDLWATTDFPFIVRGNSKRI